jgi:hypothetical protein
VTWRLTARDYGYDETANFSFMIDPIGRTTEYVDDNHATQNKGERIK